MSKGWTSVEAETAFSRARNLCHALGDAPEVFQALWGVWASLSVGGRMVAAREVAEEFLDRARRFGSATTLVEGHRISGETTFRLGDPAKACSHFRESRSLYDPAQDAANIALYGHNAAIPNLGYFATARW